MKKSSLLQILPCNDDFIRGQEYVSYIEFQNKKSETLDGGDFYHCTPMIFTAFPSPCICENRF